VNDALSTRPFFLLATTATALAGTALAPPGAATPVYRCGNLYAQVPCPGATPLHVDDARSDDERRQREEVTAREKRLAQALEAERHLRERPPPAPAPRQAAACAPSKASSAGARGAPACATSRQRASKAARPAAKKASGEWTAVAPDRSR